MPRSTRAAGGIDPRLIETLDGDGVYGGPLTGRGAPLEAELPVVCGEIHR